MGPLPSTEAKWLANDVRDMCAASASAATVQSFSGWLCIASSARTRRGLLAALCDPRLVRALEAMHSHPEKDWTVAALADAAHMSRTSFANHFASVLGSGPIEYLTHWRMTEARRLLADPRTSVAAVADQLGYRTEAAFRRAFKRVTGVGPGVIRRQERRLEASGATD